MKKTIKRISAAVMALTLLGTGTAISKTIAPKTYPLFQSLLKDKFEEIVYKHRNRCAHNTLSYQINKPDFNVLAKDNYEYNSYFFRYAIIILIDSILMSLFNKYLSILPEKV